MTYKNTTFDVYRADYEDTVPSNTTIAKAMACISGSTISLTALIIANPAIAASLYFATCIFANHTEPKFVKRTQQPAYRKNK